MSMSIDSTLGSSSILMQLNKMHSQLNAMSYGANNQSNKPLVNNDDNVPMVALGDSVIRAPSAGDSVGEFQALLKSAFEDVNILQNESSSMQARFDVGDRSISLADVMLASQKANISFEATMQIRNKVSDAYKTIMQMSV